MEETVNIAWRSRAPGLVLLAFLILTAILLVAGYGAPVGIGLLIGLVFGAAAGLFSVLWLRFRGGQSSMAFTSLSPSHQASSFEMPDVFRDMDRVQRVDHGALIRVIPGGAADDVAGVRLELIALEIRSSGAVAHLAATSEPPAGTPGSFARVTIEDDLATAYVAAAMGSSGSAERMRFEVKFAPAPPAGAATLRVRIDEFLDPFPNHSRAPLLGPWLLSVDLERP